ncbi:peptide ABC transporter substrate-binding protein [Brevibacillus sp. AY1]|uniref:peptide ABC transporter substrate-binding protein n=1 Tax=Brevibacillus sp. AY1 TaxID=2807621 RepID=UPI0024555186|nr:peptide ABC transporter substrate-binding protein [Brevibacillus sp. AY1]MDH4619192.1 peptide ABC transporter substrate-binding protein [Brevibacillus sp. AY1]
MDFFKFVLYAPLLLTMYMGISSEEAPAANATHLGAVYSIALDASMPLDEGLNHEMQYIAIDMTHMEKLNPQVKKQILTFFSEKYQVEVMAATLDELREKGLYDSETLMLDGVLLRLTHADITESKIVVEGSKYRSGLGAIGTKVVVEWIDGQWQVTQADITWIS